MWKHLPTKLRWVAPLSGIIGTSAAMLCGAAAVNIIERGSFSSAPLFSYPAGVLILSREAHNMKLA